jgi:hypothetical protein
MRAILFVALVGCGASYTDLPVVPPAAFASATAPTSHTRVGCVDVAVSRIARVPSPVLTYAFTNECDHETKVDNTAWDLQTVVVEPDGDWTSLHPAVRQHSTWTGYRLDPHETRVAEREYTGGGLPDGAKICVDFGAADQAVAYQPRWTCVHY